MKMNARIGDDHLKVYVENRDGVGLYLNAYLSPEFDDEGFLRVMGQKKGLCIHKSNISLFTWEFLDKETDSSLASGQADKVA